MYILALKTQKLQIDLPYFKLNIKTDYRTIKSIQSHKPFLIILNVKRRQNNFRQEVPVQ